MMQIESAHSPAWAESTNTTINMMVKFAEFDSEIPFSAHADDVEAHSRLLFQAAVTGEFGPITPAPVVVRTVTEARTEKLSELAKLRLEHEEAGITIGGARIDTNRGAQAMLTAAFTSMTAGFISSTPWKGADGVFRPVTLAQITPIAQAVAIHVNACFSNEQTHTTAIAALPDDVAQIDAYDTTTGWPA